MIKNLGKGEIYFWKVYIYLASIGISYIADFLLILLPSHSKCNHYPLLSGNRSNMLPRVTIRPFIAHSAISFRRAFHTSMLSLAPKVVATRVLPAQSQARLEAQDFNLTQWQQDSNMPRETLLKEVQGVYICAN